MDITQHNVAWIGTSLTKLDGRNVWVRGLTIITEDGKQHDFNFFGSRTASRDLRIIEHDSRKELMDVSSNITLDILKRARGTK